MKFLLLALLVFAPLPTFAADGLIQVPDDAVVAQPSTGLIFADNADEYIRIMKENVLSLKKSVISTRAANMRPSADVGCLPFHDAFGFEQVSETDFKVNCFAGSAKNITHVLDYRFNLVIMPATCGSDQAIRDFFAIPNNRNANAAKAYWAQIRSYCSIMAAPADPANPIVRNVAVGQAFVNKVLNEKEDLRLYVNGSRGTKKGNTSGDKYSNPLKSGAISAD